MTIPSTNGIYQLWVELHIPMLLSCIPNPDIATAIPISTSRSSRTAFDEIAWWLSPHNFIFFLGEIRARTKGKHNIMRMSRKKVGALQELP
jgi:hypothetical protein